MKTILSVLPGIALIPIGIVLFFFIACLLGKFLSYTCGGQKTDGVTREKQ